MVAIVCWPKWSATATALFFAASSALSLTTWDGATPLAISDAKGESGAHQVRGQASRGWLPTWLFGARRMRRLNDGLLLVTDRQALLLRDYAPANSGGTHLGYLARSWPLGRLVAASAAGRRLAGGGATGVARARASASHGAAALR